MNLPIYFAIPLNFHDWQITKYLAELWRSNKLIRLSDPPVRE